MKQITDRMADTASGAKRNSDEFKKTKRIVRTGLRVHKGKQDQRCSPCAQFKVFSE
jgi:hypothetical protein